MSVQASWYVPPREKYRLGGGTAPDNTGSPLAIVSGPAQYAADAAHAYHPDSPLFWAAGLIAVTFGLVGISGSVRVGRARASASVDEIPKEK